jgi:hypothetical protein
VQPKLSLPRIVSILTALAILLLGYPFAARAAEPSSRLEVLSVKAGESVTVRAHNLPANQLFVVQMDADGNQGVNGVRITLTNSGAGGTFDETYNIPPTLKNVIQLVIRLQTEKGEHAVFASFTNKTGIAPNITLTPTATLKATLAPSVTATAGQVTPNPTIELTPISSAVGGKPRIAILGVLQSQTISLRAENFPPKQTFVIRVGPYETFFSDYVLLGRINSGQGGSFTFDLALPAALKNAELLTIRLDGGGYVAYNVFSNVTAGATLTPVPSATPTASATPLPSPTAVPTLTATPAPVVGCRILSSEPSASVTAGSDYDAVWEVRNTSGHTWVATIVDYAYVSGAAGHKKTRYDLPAGLESGSSLKIIADMRAPSAAGNYTETWAIQEGTATLCTFKVNVTVK